MKTRIRIDPEIKALLPKLDEQELATLHSNLAERGGPRDPLVVWKEEGILLDGHNRYGWCQKKNVEPPVEELSLPDRAAAIQWVIDNQLGRRNLTDGQRSYYIGKEYQTTKGKRGGAQGRGDAAKRVGKKHKVSAATVRRDGEFAEAVDVLPEDEKQAVLEGAAGVTKEEVIASVKAGKPVFCPRCQRNGPARDCPQCKELRTESKATRPRKKKSGRLKFDWKAFDKDFGRVVRHVDSYAAAYEVSVKTVLEPLNEAVDKFKKIEQRRKAK